jgi:uncharacterized protein YutE (UPF0331/DUF86 family)/predicted nucleotidyltransferase
VIVNVGVLVLDIVRVLGLALDSSRRARNIELSSELAVSAMKWEVYSCLKNFLDSVAMIVADLGLVKPSSYGELGGLLSEKGIVGEADAEVIRKAAVTRNVIAHAYRRVEREDLLSIVDALLPKVEELCKILIGYVRESNLDPANVSSLACMKAFKKNDVKLAYLFGSRARGICRQDSDYDFAVVFGRKVGLDDEVGLVLDLAEDLGVSVDRVDVVALDGANCELFLGFLGRVGLCML